jgi:hypothetical protein
MSQVNVLAVSLYTRPARIGVGVGGWVGGRFPHLDLVLDHMSVCVCVFSADELLDALGRDVHVSGRQVMEVRGGW